MAPKGYIPMPEKQFVKTEWIVIVSIGGAAVVLSGIGSVLPVILVWVQWCCCLCCGRKQGKYEP